MDSLNRLFIALIMHRHNFQMIHWNVVGDHFDSVHTITDEYQSKMSDDIDLVAEFMKMRDPHVHIPTIVEAIDQIKEDDHEHLIVQSDNHISCETAWKLTEKIFDELIELCDEARPDCPSDIQSEIDGMMYYYRKEGRYKCSSRLSHDD